MEHSFSGSGPGIQTPDGCSVDLYRQLPYMGELNDIEGDLRRHSSALELGCGTGRLCRRMHELGIRATGVDESAEMLAYLPPEIEGIKGSIETLDLGRRWPAVLLPSHLINHPSELARRQFVASAKRHLKDGGVFYVKRHSPSWLFTVKDGFLAEVNGVKYHAKKVARSGDFVSMTLCYEAFDQIWTQSFTACALEIDQVEDLLSNFGFTKFKWLGDQALWVAASAGDA